MTPEELMRIHAICQLFRETEHWKRVCLECDATVHTPYGTGTPWCFLRAKAAYDIATMPVAAPETSYAAIRAGARGEHR